MKWKKNEKKIQTYLLIYLLFQSSIVFSFCKTFPSKWRGAPKKSCMPKTCKVFYCRFGYARPGILDFAWKIGWKWYIKWCSLPCLHASDHQKIPPALVYRAEQQDHLSRATHQHFPRKMGLAKKICTRIPCFELNWIKY